MFLLVVVGTVRDILTKNIEILNFHNNNPFDTIFSSAADVLVRGLCLFLYPGASEGESQPGDILLLTGRQLQLACSLLCDLE